MNRYLTIFLLLSLLLHSILAYSDQKKYYSIDEASRNPESVEILDLDNSGLQKFPMEILNFKNLKALYINSNFLSELPSEIGTLTKLEELHISSNYIM
ncbi:MAG: hypothetical protein C0594_05360, partial [Marinilabiliales bacterium]